VPPNLPLFGTSLPDGFHYRDEFITPVEERELVAAIEQVEFANFEMRGVIARRRVAFFGAAYSESAVSSQPIPEFLLPYRARAAAWAGVAADELAMALINEYRPGAPIGWHRDAPQYEIIVGLSLLSSCRMRLRPYVAPSAARSTTGRLRRRTTHEIELEQRSGYIISGIARREYEHSIPEAKHLRYSITFRSLRVTRSG